MGGLIYTDEQVEWIKEHRNTEENISLIIKDYFNLGGQETDCIDNLSKDDKKLLDACCWRHGANIKTFTKYMTKIKKKEIA